MLYTYGTIIFVPNGVHPDVSRCRVFYSKGKQVKRFIAGILAASASAVAGLVISAGTASAAPDPDGYGYGIEGYAGNGISSIYGADGSISGVDSSIYSIEGYAGNSISGYGYAAPVAYTYGPADSSISRFVENGKFVAYKAPVAMQNGMTPGIMVSGDCFGITEVTVTNPNRPAEHYTIVVGAETAERTIPGDNASRTASFAGQSNTAVVSWDGVSTSLTLIPGPWCSTATSPVMVA